MKVTPEQKILNLNAINEAFENKNDADHRNDGETIRVLKALWEWEDNPQKIYGAGFIKTKIFFPTGDLSFNYYPDTPVYDDILLDFSAAFQKISYDKQTNIIKVTGTKDDQNYTALFYLT
jgi:hypothetical protein